MAEILAIATYGSHRVTQPRTQKIVSAYKLGYAGAGRAVLLALLKDRAQDVTSRQASYHYVHIAGAVTVRHGYILLKITADELVQAEAVTLQSHRPAVYRWMEGAWQELPGVHSADYQPVIGRSGPAFNPLSLRIPTTEGEKETAKAGVITIEKSQHDGQSEGWWWLHGDTYPHRETLKRWGCRWSKRRKAWYYVGADLPDAVQMLVDSCMSDDAPSDDEAPCSEEEAERMLGVRLMPRLPANAPPEAPPPAAPAAIMPDKVPEDDSPPEPIRIIQPILQDDDIQAAIRQVNLVDMPAAPTRTGRVHIAQQAVGELTGSIAGNVYCYGYTTHAEVLIYINMAGPRMAVEAIRAKLSKGEAVNLHRWDAPSIELTAGQGETGKYADFFQNIPSAKFTSLILVHEGVTQPNYGGHSTTFIFEADEAQVRAQLKHHVTELVSVPVFEAWTGYLWQAGRAAKLVRPARSEGGLTIYAVELDADAWCRVITGGLSEGVIRLAPVKNSNLHLEEIGTHHTQTNRL